MLVFMHILQKQAEERVRKPTRARWVGDICVNYEDCEDGEDDTKADGSRQMCLVARGCHHGLGRRSHNVIVGRSDAHVSSLSHLA